MTNSTSTETVTADRLSVHDVVRLPEGNAEVVFVKVTAKIAQVTFLRETNRGTFGGRYKREAEFVRFVREEA